jgi:TRAP-type mannitol/chloroaromatic compound transport system substrate-binding protein
MRNMIVGIIVGVVVGIVVGTTVVAPRLALPVQVKAERKAKLAENEVVRQEIKQAVAEAYKATPNAGGNPATASTAPKAAADASPAPASVPKPAAPVAAAPGRVSGAYRPPAEPPAAPRRQWRMASAYPSAMAELGGLGKRLEATINRVSGERLRLKFFEPGTLVANAETLAAVKSGTIEAAFASPAIWAAESPVLHLFSGIPFGPPIQEYLAWLHADGGVLLTEAFEKIGVHALVCGMLAPEGSGWFRRPVRSLEQLKGLNVGMNGLGGKVLAKLGVNVSPMAEGDVFVGLERGIIDGAAAAQPTLDLELGLYRMARHYYFPSWHRPAGTLVLAVNSERWNALDVAAKSQIESACGDNVTHGLGETEASQFGALKVLSERGVSIENWAPEILDALRKAWKDLAAEMAAKDKDFARAWASLQRFGEEYGIWRELGTPGRNAGR